MENNVTLTTYELELFAYHITVLSRDRGTFGLSLGAAHVDVSIVPSSLSETAGDVWDACTMNGHSVGNRQGACKAYARWVAGDPNWMRAR